MKQILGLLVFAALTAQAQQAPQPAPAPGSPERFDRFVGLTAQIDQLSAQLTELRRRYTETHPEVRAAQERLNGLRAQLNAERDRITPSAANARQAAERAALEANRARLNAELVRVAPPGSSRTLPDNWWRSANIASMLQLTPAQVKQMEETFQQHRLRLIDLNAALEKEEVTLEPMVAADRLDEGKVTAQIDRVAQARADLEKYRGRMLVGIRKVLEPEQWRKLSEMGFTVTSH